MGFEFVLVNDKHGQEKVRKHLRQRQSDLRRKKIQDLKGATEALRATSVVGHGPLQWRKKEADRDLVQPDSQTVNGAYHTTDGRRPSVVAIEPPYPPASGSGRDVDSPGAWSPGSEVDRATSAMPMSPHDLLGSARRNPFQTYPIPWDAEIDRLFDLYIHLSSYIFDYPANDQKDLFRRQAHESMDDPAAFHALMLFAAVNDDRFSGRIIPGMRSLHHRLEAVKLINDRLDSPDPNVKLSKSTIYTVSRLHVLEKQFKAVGNDEVHTSGVQRLVVLFGGLHKLAEAYPSVTVMVYLSALVTPGMLRSASPSLYGNGDQNTDMSHERYALASELLDFLEQLSSDGKNHYRKCALVKSTTGNTGPICKLLTTSATAKPGFAEHTRHAIMFLNNQLRLSSILHTHLAILAIQSSEDLTMLVQHLRWILSYERLWRTSIRLFHYLLIQNAETENLANPDLAWKVLRLSDGLKLLPPETREELREVLLGVLSGASTMDELDIGAIRAQLTPYLTG